MHLRALDSNDMAMVPYVPDETLAQIVDEIHPGDLVSFARCSKRFLTLSASRVEEHRELHRRYSILLVTDQRVSGHSNVINVFDLMNDLDRGVKIAYHLRNITIRSDPERIEAVMHSLHRSHTLRELALRQNLNWMPELVTFSPTANFTVLLCLTTHLKSLSVRNDFFSSAHFQIALVKSFNLETLNDSFRSPFRSVQVLRVQWKTFSDTVSVHNLIGFPSLKELSLTGMVVVDECGMAEIFGHPVALQSGCTWLASLRRLEIQDGHIAIGPFSTILSACLSLEILFYEEGRILKRHSVSSSVKPYCEALCNATTRHSLRELTFDADAPMGDLCITSLENLKDLILRFRYSTAEDAPKVLSSLPRSLHSLEVGVRTLKTTDNFDWDLDLVERALGGVELETFERLHVIDFPPNSEDRFRQDREASADCISRFYDILWRAGVSVCPLYYSAFEPRPIDCPSRSADSDNEWSETMWDECMEAVSRADAGCFLRWRDYVFRLERERCCDLPAYPECRIVNNQEALNKELERLKNLPDYDSHRLRIAE